MPKSAPIDLCGAQGIVDDPLEPTLDEGSALFLDVDGTLVRAVDNSLCTAQVD